MANRYLPQPVVYSIPDSHQRIIVEAKVLNYLKSFRQLSSSNFESGGQLFAILTDGDVQIKTRNGPNKKDICSSFHFIPDLQLEQKAINSQFKKGLHYVGDWHTHPQDEPAPSDLDFNTMSSCFSNSKHQLDSILRLIVGRLEGTNGIWLSQHTANFYRQLMISESKNNFSKSTLK
jgi:integrative and conjugative element protein (TIGR02256 family)